MSYANKSFSEYAMNFVSIHIGVMNFGNNASSLRRHLKSNYKFSNMQLHAHRLSSHNYVIIVKTSNQPRVNYEKEKTKN